MSIKCLQGAWAVKNDLREIQQHWHVAWLRCSVLSGQPFAMELHLTSPSKCEWSVFGVPRALPPLTFFSYVKSMATVYGRQKRVKVDLSSCMGIQTSMMNSILVSLLLWPKQLQKWSKKCFNITPGWNTFPDQWWVEKRGRRPPVQESSVSRVHEKYHSTCKMHRSQQLYSNSQFNGPLFNGLWI